MVVVLGARYSDKSELGSLIPFKGPFHASVEGTPRSNYKNVHADAVIHL